MIQSPIQENPKNQNIEIEKDNDDDKAIENDLERTSNGQFKITKTTDSILESSIDLLLAHQIGLIPFFFVGALYTLQLVVIIYIFGSVTKPQGSYDLTQTTIGGLFAAVAAVASLFDSVLTFNKVFNIATKIRDSTWDNFVKQAVVLAELFLIVFLVLTIIYLIPQQKDITDMVLNATAIIVVYQLDEEVFKILKIKYQKIDPEIIKQNEVPDEKLYPKMNFYFLIMVVLMFIAIYSETKSLRDQGRNTN